MATAALVLLSASLVLASHVSAAAAAAETDKCHEGCAGCVCIAKYIIHGASLIYRVFQGNYMTGGLQGACHETRNFLASELDVAAFHIADTYAICRSQSKEVNVTLDAAFLKFIRFYEKACS